MNSTHYPSLNETLYSGVLPNGLSVYIVPKQSYHKTYVTLSTPLGSTITDVSNSSGNARLPDGIAHFLEHKLFDRPDMDVSSTFAMQSAQVNAYTMNQRTTYLFSCTDRLYDNMATLLDFVFHPTFTKEGIEKEIGIISQEISMYHDDPNVAIYLGLLEQMYHNHPIKNDILGTKDTISTITAELLQQVHSNWYHPDNMVLFITGNVDPDTMWAWLQANGTNPDSMSDCVKSHIKEPDTIVKAHGSKEMDIILPNALFGMKLPVAEMHVYSIMKWELIFSMFTDIIMGRSTTTYQALLHDELINDTFGMDITLEEEYGFLLFGGQTSHPEELFKRLQSIIMSADVDTMDKAHFERSKKQVIGHFIQALNSLEYIANQFTKYHFMNVNVFDVLNVMQSITLEDIRTLLSFIQDETKISTYVILPKRKDNH